MTPVKRFIYSRLSNCPCIQRNESERYRQREQSNKTFRDMKTNELFAMQLKEDIATLRKVYEKWQFAEFKPQGTDIFIDELCSAIAEAEIILLLLKD